MWLFHFVFFGNYDFAPEDWRVFFFRLCGILMLGSTWHSKKMRQSSWSCCKILSSTIECTLLSLCNYNTNLWCTKLSVWKTKLSDGTHVDCRLHMIHMTWELLTLHLSQCMHWKQIWGRWNSLLRDPLGYRPKLLPAKKMGCWNSEKVTLSQGQCFPTTAGQLSLPNMAAFGGSKDSRVFVASGIKHAWTWADQFFQIFNLTDGGSLVQKKDSRKVAQLTKEKAFGLFWRLGCN